MEKAAIIQDVFIGNRDVGTPCMWFTTKEVLTGLCALQILSWSDAEKLIKASGLYDFQGLEGKPCVVFEKDGKQIIERLAL